MKNAFCLLLAILLSIMLMGCSAISDSNLLTRTYVYQESEEAIKPTVTIEEDNAFLFFYSALSSYLGVGHYEIDTDILILKTDDGENEYVFDIENETLIFNAEKSSGFPSYANVPNGAVFR